MSENYWRLIDISSLHKRDYRRYKCKVCGSYFWSLIPRDNCNDVPCSDYTFFDIPIRSKDLTPLQVRDRFLGFFSRMGHKVIDPKPVVARWREDLYLTIASIVVFQPHVTSGIVPPPANPLVIAQPCIRLEDVDSVGYTLGRHLTNFIMGGHHAFNYPDKYVYFSSETVEYAIDFFVNDIGVPEEELVFKESWWEGGGNAGPCLEVTVGGLEVATLVFMMFKSLDRGYMELPLKIVDTGYGIERISWLTTKSPTAFHAVYRDLVGKYFKLLELDEAPQEVLWSSIKLINKYDVRTSDGYAKFKEGIASELGLNYLEVSNHLDNLVKVATLLDHVKTAILLLSDDVVPSNAGEGYLARLVLRRIFRILKSLNRVEVINELFKEQLSYWIDLYTNIARKSSYILDVVNVELSRYDGVLKRAGPIIRKYLSGGLNLERLVELYDSHGIPPEVVVEEGNKLGISVNVPENFYSLIASRHSRPPIKGVRESKIPQEVVKRFTNLKSTRLFHVDPYLKSFKAKVVGVVGRYLVLDETAFYPEGGGQESDRGIIRVDDLVLNVIDVQKVDDVIIHVVDRELSSELVGKEVVGEVDWNRRYSLMRHHTATHVVLAAARKVLGDHVWQAGAEKSEDISRLDITHYRGLSDEEVKLIEEVANDIVNKCLDVRVNYLPKYDAEELYGFRLYQGGAPLEPIIRVVEIPGVDAQACFGTHLRNTCEVGGIKLVNVRRIQDGVVRLEFVAGTQLVKYARDLEKLVTEAKSLLGGGDLIKRIKSINDETRFMKGLINAYRRSWGDLILNEIVKTSEYVGNVGINVKLFEVPDEEMIREVLKKATSQYPLVLIALIPGDGGRLSIEVSVSNRIQGTVRATDVLSYVIAKYGGKGGGRSDHASGYILTGDLLEEVLSNIKLLVKEFIESRLKG